MQTKQIIRQKREYVNGNHVSTQARQAHEHASTQTRKARDLADSLETRAETAVFSL